MDVSAIARTKDDFVAALRNGDAVAASAIYADDAQLLAPSAELFAGRDAITAFWRAGLEAGVSEVEFEALQLDREGGFAFEIGRYAFRLEAVDGGTVVDRGKYVLVHRRQEDGSWRRVVEMFNPDAPPLRTDGARKEE